MFPHCFLYFIAFLHLPSCIPQNGQTALRAASFEGHQNIVELLTNAGAAVDVQDEVCGCEQLYLVCQSVLSMGLVT